MRSDKHLLARMGLVGFPLFALALLVITFHESAAGQATGNSQESQIGHLQGEMAGEVTQESVILHSRLTGPSVGADGDVPGAAGVARFEFSDDPEFANAKFTDWLTADSDRDYIVQVKVTGLKPATRYFYRLVFGPTRDQVRTGPRRTFRTLHPADSSARHSFVVVTGMNYGYFHEGQKSAQGKVTKAPYAGPDKHLGYPALVSMLKLQRKPDFFVGTGDNVYYDAPRRDGIVAQTEAAMRKKWHEQFVQPRYVDLFAEVPTYWEKDDHDFRYDDCDNTGNRPPSVPLGLRIFREQVPVVDPKDPEAVTYRTHRCGKLLQIWLPENRDYRSPNAMPDGPEKTIWGAKQREWLQRTLLESDAPFRVIVSPTPMIGPDDLRKKDNHCDIGGFQHERDAFFNWAKEKGLIGNGLFLVCGDRHWQYHVIHPSGMEEFSSGALVDANSRMGVKPGDPNGTDPNAEIQQPYTSREPSGGFLNVVVEPAAANDKATIRFRFHDEHGELLHEVVREEGKSAAGRQ
jgi:alkaline phosphatase/alkaline phosphatase D